MVNVMGLRISDGNWDWTCGECIWKQRGEELGLVVLERGRHIHNAKMYPVKIVKQGVFAQLPPT